MDKYGGNKRNLSSSGPTYRSRPVQVSNVSEFDNSTKKTGATNSRNTSRGVYSSAYGGSYRDTTNRVNDGTVNSSTRNRTRSAQTEATNNDDFTSKPYFTELGETHAFKLDPTGKNPIYKFFIYAYRLVTVIVFSVYYFFKWIYGLLQKLCGDNKILKTIIIVIAALLVLWLIDFIIWNGKIYPGVKVGGVDVGGKTTEEAAAVLDETYSTRLHTNVPIIYATEQAKQIGADNIDNGQYTNEQVSAEDAKKATQYWKAPAADLSAYFPSEEIAHNATEDLRSFQNIFKRISALFGGYDIKPYANYNPDQLEALIMKVEDTLGVPRVDSNVKMENGSAVVVEGHDGKEIIDSELKDQLNTNYFLPDPNANESKTVEGSKTIYYPGFVPNIYDSKQRISKDCAQDLANQINAAIKRPVIFKYGFGQWNADMASLCSMINSSIFTEGSSEGSVKKTGSGCGCSQIETFIDAGESSKIVASVDYTLASSSIINKTRSVAGNSEKVQVTFTKDAKGTPLVKASGDAEIPYVAESIEKLNAEWLKNACSYEKDARQNKSTNLDKYNSSEPIVIQINNTKVPESLSVQDALTYGLVSNIASYTTTYTSGSGTENRNSNIALVSSLLDNSIVQANGGQWSFNTIAGDTTPERGFKEAGTIVGNEYTTSVGGGVCQVATTVFNAVFDSGLPVISRVNHDLHMESYPAGRDAAISYPAPDLIWSNDTSSDILVQVSCTGYSVTCTLVGVSPEYKVTSEEGKWEEGEKFTTQVVVDPSKKENSSFIQTTGSDGKSISVTRKVYNKAGQLIRTDVFQSKYKPKTEIKVIGPGKEADQLLASGGARMKKETDKW